MMINFISATADYGNSLLMAYYFISQPICLVDDEALTEILTYNQVIAKMRGETKFDIPLPSLLSIAQTIFTQAY